MTPDYFCVNSLSLYPVNIFNRPVGSIMVLIGMLYVFMSLSTIVCIKRQEYIANQAEEDREDIVVKSVIFPVFVYALWLNAAVNIYVGIIALTFTFVPFNLTSYGAAWAFSIMWALQHCVVEGIAIMLMQKGLGFHAAKTASFRIILWGLFTLFAQLATYISNDQLAFFADLTWESLLFFFYLALWITPQKKLFRRPAAINYARFWCVFRVLTMTATILAYIGPTRPAGLCIDVFGSLLIFALFEPILVYYTLLQDSRWWQGK